MLKNSTPSAAISLPRVACLCPTYGRPTLLANALACFEAQDYEGASRLFILDDAGQFEDSDPGDRYFLRSTQTRFASLPSKYNYLIKHAQQFAPDIWLVWDDDDVYLPWYIRSHVEAQLGAMFPKDDTGSVPPVFNKLSQPDPVFSDYPGKPTLEGSAGRFHGSIGIGKHLLRQLGNSWIQTRRADFDQQMIAACIGLSTRVLTSPKEKPGYIFRWGTTNAYHCQGLMKTPDDETWYDRYHITEPGWAGKLFPRFDEVTRRYYEQLAPEYTLPS